jgi:hypothetical protein
MINTDNNSILIIRIDYTDQQKKIAILPLYNLVALTDYIH